MLQSKVLDFAIKEGEITTADVANEFNKKIVNASTPIKSLYKKGILDRYKVDNKTGRDYYIYYPTDKAHKIIEQYGSYKMYSIRQRIANSINYGKDEEKISILD